MVVFVSVRKEGKKKKTKKLRQFLKSHISGILEVILLNFGLWNADVGGHVHSKIILFHKGSTELQMRENPFFFLSIYSFLW